MSKGNSIERARMMKALNRPIEVKSKFRSFSSRQISEYSHQESAWIETPEHEPIDYSFATDLREFSLV